MTIMTECSCTTTDTYRQLDRACQTHGDEADTRRRAEAEELRQRVERLTEELASFRDALAEQVTTRRLVVVDEHGQPVVYTQQLEHSVQLIVKHRDAEDNVERTHDEENVAAIALHAGHESDCEAGWNVSVDGDIGAMVMVNGGDVQYLGRARRRVSSYLQLERRLLEGYTTVPTSERALVLDPATGAELQLGGGVAARTRFELVDPPA